MKKYIFIIYCVVFAYHSYSQVDTNNFYWRKFLYEVYSTQQDSLAFYPYYLKKKPYFESYFNSYTEAELKKMQEKSFDMMYYPNKDSLRDPAYLQEQAYSWVISRMLFGYYLDNLYDSLQTAYDAKGDTIELDFYLKGKHVNLYRNYRIIYLVYTENGEKNRIDACTLENAFLAPDIGMDTAGIVLLKYKRRYYDITFCEKHLQDLKKEVKISLIYEIKPFENPVTAFSILDQREELVGKSNMKGVLYVSCERFRRCKSDYFEKESDYFRAQKKKYYGKR